ncbi:TFIID subunit (TBP-associated factor), partial [Scheffersomyces stipitis CBS 6054]
MAIKLKLRVPGSGSSSSSSAPASESQPALPKLKIKPPSIADNSTGKVSKKSKEKSKEKHKKLKISLSSKRPSTSSDIVTPSSGSVTTRSVPRVRIKPTRIPGDGYDSEAPDLEDDPLIEQGIVIRFLQDLNLDFVHNAVDSGDLTGINVKWVTREKAVVNVNGTLYSARLLDLPTVTEIFKTVDKKNVMKTFDVSQILLVLHKVVLSDLSMEKDFEVPEEYTYLHPLYKISKNSEIKPSKQVFRHGLTSPFEDVYRRFRVRKSTHRVAEDIENR